MSIGLSSKQLHAIKHSTYAINIWDGSVSSGKTIAWLVLMLGEIATAGPVGELVIMGKNLDAVWRNVFKPLMGLPLFAHAREEISYKQGATTATIFGHEVHIIGFNDSSSEERIRGGTFQKVFVDEATLMPEVTWNMLVTRMRATGNPGPPRIFVTTNPGSSAHYLKTNFLDKAKETGTGRQTFTMRDNPTLTPDYIRRTEASFTGVFYLRMIKGQWVAAEGAIYAGWDPEVMTVDARDIVPPGGEITRDSQVRIIRAISFGIDYGTQHPTAGHLLCLGEDGRIYLTHEWAPNPGSQRRTDKQLADDLQRFMARLADVGLTPRFIYCDPAAASFREELMQRGITTHRADNDVLNGIALMDAVLMSGDLKISRTCKHLIAEIPNYVWDMKAAERGKDQPVKEKDDFADSARYCLASSRHIWRKQISAAA